MQAPTARQEQVAWRRAAHWARAGKAQTWQNRARSQRLLVSARVAHRWRPPSFVILRSSSPAARCLRPSARGPCPPGSTAGTAGSRLVSRQAAGRQYSTRQPTTVRWHVMHLAWEHLLPDPRCVHTTLHAYPGQALPSSSADQPTRPPATPCHPRPPARQPSAAGASRSGPTPART